MDPSMGAKTPHTCAVLLVSALLACKAKQQEPEPAASAQPPDPKAEAARRRAALGAGDFRMLCDGRKQSLPDAAPRAAGKEPRVIAFYRDAVKEAQGDYAEHSLESAGFGNLRAVWASDATVVACVDVVKKQKVKDCKMTGLEDDTQSLTLPLMNATYRFRLIEAHTGKEIATATKERSHIGGRCPQFAQAKDGEEQLPLWEASLYVMASDAT